MHDAVPYCTQIPFQMEPGHPTIRYRQFTLLSYLEKQFGPPMIQSLNARQLAVCLWSLGELVDKQCTPLMHILLLQITRDAIFWGLDTDSIEKVVRVLDSVIRSE